MKQKNILKVVFSFFLLISSLFINGQTTIFDESGGGTVPAGWTANDISGGNVFDKGSYWLLDSGSPSDNLITSSNDLSAYDNGTFTISIKSFGSGTHRELKVEVSTDGGATFPESYLTSVTTSSYVTQTVNIPTVNATTVIKLSNNGTSGRGIRMRDIKLTATGSSPIISFDNAISTENEADIDVVTGGVPISLTGYAADVTVTATVNGSSTAAPADYTIDLSTITFTSNETKNIPLTIKDDADFDNETIIIDFTVTSGTASITIGQHTVTINDDENAPSIGFDSATSSETETDITFTSTNIPITVSNYSGTQIDINVSVTGGTAEVGDYTFTSPTALSFSADGSQNITLEINDDADTDGETVILTITETSSVNSLTISQSSHTLTISDDEIPPLPTSGTIFITEVLDSENGYTNDYLELFNNSNQEVNLYTSKLLRFSSAGVYEYSFDFGIDEATASVDLKIPAYGFLIIARGDTRAEFNTANSITLDAGVNYNGGNSDLYFGTGRRWKLKTGGTADTNDGDLIDDTLSGIGTAKDYRNIFTNTFITGATSDGTPGELEYLVYNGGAWVNTTAMDGTTAAKDAYIYDDYTVSANASANDLGIASDNTLTVSGTSGLNLAGDLTVSGSLSITAGGSLIVSGTSSGNITYNINAADTDWHLVSSPVAGEGFNDTWANSNSIADGSGTNRGISTYQNGTLDTDTDGGGADTETGPWVYMLDGESGTFGSGTGYSLKRTSSGTYSFTGTYPTTSVTPAITQDVTNWNLIGNPYPSYINISDFITEVALSLGGAFQNIYVWSASTSSYNPLTTGYIYPGQAFFISSNLASGNISITEAMQSHQTGVTFYKTENTTVIDLNLTSGENTKSTQINYLENKTTGLDPRFDIGMFDGVASDIRIYTQLISNNEGISFRRQALPDSGYESMVIPVGVKAAAGKEITFSIDALNLPADIKVFLEDRLTNTFTRLDEMNSEYKVTLSETLNGIGRFYMHTTESVLSAEGVILNSVRIYKTDASTLKITGLPQGKTSFYLYNILGKEMMTTLFTSNGNKEISLSKLASGIYLAKMQTEKGAISKKIILE